MATYVEGEAPETDSEDEQYLFNLSYMKVGHSISWIPFKLFAHEFKIGNENSTESPNKAVNNAKDIFLKGNVVDGVTDAEDLMNTPVATEITEEFTPIYPMGEPTTPAEFFYENDLLRKKISNELNYLRKTKQFMTNPVDRWSFHEHAEWFHPNNAGSNVEKLNWDW